MTSSSRSPAESPQRAADLRSGGRFLLGLALQHRRQLAFGGAVAILWMLGEAVSPVILGRTIDAGILGRDASALLGGCLLLLVVGLAAALLGTLLHRLSVGNWLTTALGTQHLIGHHVADHGLDVGKETTTGEVVEAVGRDTHKIGELFETGPRAAGAVVTYPVVVVVVIQIDLVAGLWVAIGLPLMTMLLGVLVGPLQFREREQRMEMGRLTALGADTAAGLRVLRGIGGERQFVQRYRERSQVVRRKGTRVARAWGVVEFAQVGLPGIFIVVLIWLGARGVMSGRLSAGELVVLYGSAAWLRLPLDIASQILFDLISARVAAERVVALLRRGAVERSSWDAAVVLPEPPPDVELVDPASGVRLVPRVLTGLVSAVPKDANEIAERMAGLAPGDTRLGGVPLEKLARSVVRQRIQLNEAEPRLFSGTLRQQVDPDQSHGDGAILAALAAADSLDVLDGLPDGLNSEVEERGRGFSGGQRQRLALARALLANANVLMLMEPTSAVDAHTEARVAQRLRSARAGRTTLVTTASPLLLQECDRVLLLERGQVASEGTHRHLMNTSAVYRSVVTRDLSESEESEEVHR